MPHIDHESVIMGRRTVTLRRNHHALIVQPACADALEQLQTIEHVAVNDPKGGCRLKAVPRAIYKHVPRPASAAATATAEAPMGVRMVGMERAVRCLLRRVRS